MLAGTGPPSHRSRRWRPRSWTGCRRRRRCRCRPRRSPGRSTRCSRSCHRSTGRCRRATSDRTRRRSRSSPRSSELWLLARPGTLARAGGLLGASCCSTRLERSCRSGPRRRRRRRRPRRPSPGRRGASRRPRSAARGWPGRRAAAYCCAAVGVPGGLRELQAAVVAVAGVDGPVAAALALGDGVPGGGGGGGGRRRPARAPRRRRRRRRWRRGRPAMRTLEGRRWRPL